MHRQPYGMLIVTMKKSHDDIQQFRARRAAEWKHKVEASQDPALRPSRTLRPKWLRITYRALGILFFLIAIWTYTRSLENVKSGDLDIAYNYREQRLVSNRALRITFVLICAGTVCVGLSIANKSRDDKTSS